MTVKKSPWGETSRQVYAVLRRHPGLSINEICRKIPGATYAAVHSALSKLMKRGSVQQMAAPNVPTPGRGRRAAHTYRVKYKGIKVQEAQPAKPKPEYKAERTKKAQPAANTDALVVHHLTDIYKALTLMTDQQDALIAILKDTLLQLDATEQELERERQRRNWWDKIKEIF